MGHLNKLFEEYDEKGFTIISASGESKDTVQAFVDQLGATYPIFAQTGGGLNAYSTGGVPSACLISAEGKIVWAGHPAALSEDQIDAELKSIDKDRRISTWAFNLTRTMPEVPESLDKDAKNLMKGKFGATLKSVEKAVEKLEGDDKAKGEALRDWIAGVATKRMETAAGLVGNNQVYAGFKMYGEIEDLFNGHDLGKQAKDAAKALEKDKETGLEIKASEKLEEIKKEIANERKAEDKVKCLKPLLSKKYENTAAGKEAAKMADELEKGGDGGAAH